MENNHRKVWVTQERNMDYTPAEPFGELQFITAEDFWAAEKSIHNSKLMAHLRFLLAKEYKSEDFILLSGSNMVTAAIFMALGRLGHTEVNVLRWSNRDRIYEPVKLQLGV